MATSPVNPIRQAPPARRLWRSLGRLAGGLLFLGLLASAAGYWLLMTHSGARQVAQWLNASSQGAIQLQGIQGRLAGPLQLQGLVLQTAAGTAPLRLHELKLAWQPGALLERRLHISQLSIQRLQLPGTSASPLELPRDLRLPLAIHVAALDIGRIETPDASDAALLHDLRAELDSDGQRHRLSLKHARWQAHSLSAKATLQGQAPFSVSYNATKAWMNSFTEGLHMELEALRSPVRIQALCPGFTVTEFHDAIGMDRGRIPAGLWLSAEEVVDASLRGLQRNRLFVVPGRRYRWFLRILRILPQSLKRYLSIRFSREHAK